MPGFYYFRCVGLCLAACFFSGCSPPADSYLPGYAEAEYVRLAAPLAGTLLRVYVRNGESVARGAPAFVLEQEAERAEREQAVAQVRRAAAQVADARKGRRPDEVAALAAQLREAQAALALSTADLARQRRLLAARFVAVAQVDAAQAAVARDGGRVDDVQAQLRLARQGARVDAIAATQAEQAAAQAQLAQVEWKLAQKIKTAPQAGQVVEVLYREGEWVAAGSPVLILLPPANIKARFFVREALLGALTIGRPVELRCDGCAAPLAATISFIAPNAEFTAPLIYSTEQRAALVFMVEARPSPEQAIRLHPGQALEVRLR